MLIRKCTVAEGHVGKKVDAIVGPFALLLVCPGGVSASLRLLNRRQASCLNHASPHSCEGKPLSDSSTTVLYS